MTHSPEKDTYIKSFFKDRGITVKDYNIRKLAGDGSKRIFERIYINDPGLSFVLMSNFPADDLLRKENLAYLKIGKHLKNKGMPLPKIHDYDLKRGFFILEDMGDTSLQDKALGNRDRILIYEKVLDILAELQIYGIKDFKPGWCCQTKSYDYNLMKNYEAHYFRDAFLRDFIKADFDLTILDKPFERIISAVLEADNNYLLHRDFQSRNIMYRSNDRLSILDWQGARSGPLAYDLASLLFDPYTDLSDDERESLFDTYCRLLDYYNVTKVELLKRYYPYAAIMRLLQAAGAYSNLSMNQGKSYFEKYIPPALKSLLKLFDIINNPGLSLLEKVIRDACLEVNSLKGKIQ